MTVRLASDLQYREIIGVMSKKGFVVKVDREAGVGYIMFQEHIVM